MSNTLTLVGNLAADPELRFTPSGRPVANFTVADTPRRKDPHTDQWVDDTTFWQRCELWGEYAENLVESIGKGARVIVTGKIRRDEWTDKETNQPRRGTTLVVDEIGPSLKWAVARVQRAARGGHQVGGYSGPPAGQYGQQGGQPAQQSDPWGSAPTGQQPAFGAGDDEPPF